jgi:hypothetical protein
MSLPANAASCRKVDPWSGRQALIPPTSRTNDTPATRTVSAGSPNVGVANPPGLARNPNLPLTS